MRPKILIVGAGFGGMAAVKALKHADADVLLVDRTNQMRGEGLGVIPALLEAGETRLRPIVMTTLSMVIGMLPIALSSSSGAEWKTGLAWALIGGLSSSLLLTLVLVPVIYIFMESMTESVKRMFRKIVPKDDDDYGTSIPSDTVVVHSSEPQS